MQIIEYSSKYKVGDGDVRLEVTIGDGQFGSTLVTVGPKVYDQEREFDEVLGKGPAVRGKSLKVHTVVNDTNTQTNHTSVTYRLSGGPEPLEHTVSYTVSSESESVQYKARFELE